jgi:hypothetical protein
MRTRALGWVSVAVVLLAFAWFVWPTPYRYIEHRDVLYRINRFSGSAMMLLPDGWAKVRSVTERRRDAAYEACLGRGNDHATCRAEAWRKVPR